MDIQDDITFDWMMLISTLCLSIVLILIIFPKTSQVEGFRSLFSKEPKKRDRTIWLEDVQFIESFGELHEMLNSPANSQVLQEYNRKESHVTHFCFLVHGLSGFSQDLAYLETVLKILVDREKFSLSGKEGCLRHDMIVHCPTCNENKTKDGVKNGGERLLQEMIHTIRVHMRERRRTCNTNGGLRDVTISVVGNSLGGIYSRYAIAQLAERTDMVLDGQFRLHFNVFCSTASPHLGCSKFLGLGFLRLSSPIPRSAEIGVAHTMGDTGKDLFRLNGLLKTMATSPKYLQPLGSFRKRIAYANAYGTDFAVPTATAAFLHSESTYPHHVNEDAYEEEEDCVVVDDNGLVVAIFHTKPEQSSSDDETTESSSPEQENTDDLAFMSRSLDSLGWKKVFVDLRHEIPIGVNLPRLRIGQGDSSPSPQSEKEAVPPLQSLKKKRIVSSSDVASAAVMPPDLNRISWPLGHNMIVAFSRSPQSASFNKGGRPVVNALANELVEFIFSWEKPAGSHGSSD